MKRILILIFAVALISCTDNRRARTWGGTEEIKLPAGQRLVTATWKESDIWYLTEAMPEGYQPQMKFFYEKSSWGTFEGKIIFIESK